MKKQRVTHRRTFKTALRKLDTRQRAAKLLATSFGMSSTAEPPIDATLMGQLRAALAQIDANLSEACWQRGLLPTRIAEAIRMAGFLACVLPMARAAQSVTGIPASLLVADAYRLTADANAPGNDLFKTGTAFPSLLEAFLQRARDLKQHPKLKAQIARDRDVTDFISSHGLAECDSLRVID